MTPHESTIISYPVHAVLEVNDGHWPQTFREYKTAFVRFGLRKIRLVPRSILPDPILRGSVLYLPLPRSRAELFTWLSHELAELVMRYTGEPPLRYPPDWGDHHRLATLIERHISQGLLSQVDHDRLWLSSSATM